ncbi:Enamine deaminase RidA, house cleaning of reactive enamine intermediates, YjgF/YER057c/UK114 family [Eubacterium aggregans]|uniref:Enamine deaminase RidA, house cleaning of reactive enamine intermediates, YjgF/YER057c/UK114 family n=1 Tax=Eubacterium aggregans TaxID=81409 RepID=A0A1H4E9P4_9FIRM|nr:Rid family hydrolase [Eubacterium aggregans]SEA81529.1 Enamine deaminase RidA, house cleaning of reactive enamine intermediates, YjgF/YER057c/UK114 family [Eubacterium aggregans]
MERTNYASGAPLEEKVGYSRMVKVGQLIMVGGTTSVQPDGTVYGEGDTYAQAHYIFDKQVKLLEQAGATAADVVSVKAYLTDMTTSAEVSKAYSEFFHDVRPLCTFVGTSALNRVTQLCEIELMAILAD